MIAGSWDGRLRCLDLKTRTCTNVVEIRSQMKITCLSAALERSRGDAEDMWIGLEDGSIDCWNISHEVGPNDCNIEVRTWKAHRGGVTALQFTRCCGDKWLKAPPSQSFSRIWLASASEDRTIRVWAPERAELLWEFYGHGGGVLVLV